MKSTLSTNDDVYNSLPSGILFDCDGVLLDSIHAWHAVDDRLAQEADISFSVEDRNALNASTLDEAAAYFHNHLGVGDSVQAVLDTIDGYLFEFYCTQAKANAGALEFVRAVCQAHVPVCVLSSSPQRFLQAGLKRAGFLDLIDMVLSAEELPAKKRDPQLYPHVCSMIGSKPERSWLFDDSWYALEAAKSAGLHGVGVYSADACGTHDQLHAQADIVIDSFAQMSFDAFIHVAFAENASR